MDLFIFEKIIHALKFFLVISLFFYGLIPNAKCQSHSYWQQQVNYNIVVALNDVENSLTGHIKIDYFNNSPDTLQFIWIHLWPNAYKNDRTAFSNQMLDNGSTDFYFSNNDKRGYINQLNFKVNNLAAKTQDHPIHQDIIKLILPTPLLPQSHCTIETPFHVKLPYNFSRGGHVGQAYQITQWYPKPAVYDSKGWHPMPYLDQGEFYSELGNFDVQITLPTAYKLAATGQQKIAAEISKEGTTTFQYYQKNVHDFAWFADKNFIEAHDTLQLSSGRVIELKAFYYSKNAKEWNNSIAMMKRAILTKCQWIGEYPFDVVSVVDEDKSGGGMEYPTIALLSAGGSSDRLQNVINHEIGHNWFYAILANDERSFAWMDEGINTFYDKRFASIYPITKDGQKWPSGQQWKKNKFPDKPEKMFLQTQIALKKDQPINTPSQQFSSLNYGLIAYEKAAQWMQLIENKLGKNLLDSCMKEYYNRYSFKHPYPDDFKNTLEEVSQKKLDSLFLLLNAKGNIEKDIAKKSIKPAFLFNLKQTDKYNYVGISPAIGYNFYDKLMIGAIVHNYSLPIPKFQFIIAPLYATKSKQLNAIGKINYNWYPGSNGQKIEWGISGATFTIDNFTDAGNKIHYLRFSKIVPSVKYIFANKNPQSTIIKFVQWKTFLINEQQLNFYTDPITRLDTVTFPNQFRYLNQLQFSITHNRILYPYNAVAQIEQGSGFIRTNFTGNYFFNYAKGGGLNVRLFAGKFFYTTSKTYITQFNTDAYHLNMSGPKGYEDYTYSNYFVGRNEFDGFPSQQIMIRDGGFKVTTDLLSSKIGKTDNWLTAANFTSTIPKNINPFGLLPIKNIFKAFLDVGTYAEAWQKNAPTGKFVYDAGLQFSLLKNTLNIYVPLLYSKVYKDYFKSTLTGSRFLHTISFSIDVQNFSLQKLFPKISF